MYRTILSNTVNNLSLQPHQCDQSHFPKNMRNNNLEKTQLQDKFDNEKKTNCIID